MCPQTIGRPSFYFSAWGAGSGQASSRPQPLWYFRARSTWTGHRHNTYITLHRHVTSRCSRHVPSRHVTSLHVSSRLVPVPGSRFKVPQYIMSRHVTSRSQVPVSRYLLSRTFLGRDTTTCGDAVLRPPLELSLVAVAEPLDPLQVQVQAFGALHLQTACRKLNLLLLSHQVFTCGLFWLRLSCAPQHYSTTFRCSEYLSRSPSHHLHHVTLHCHVTSRCCRHVISRCCRHVTSRHVTSRHITSRHVPLPGSRFEVPLYITSHYVTSRPDTRFQPLKLI